MKLIERHKENKKLQQKTSFEQAKKNIRQKPELPKEGVSGSDQMYFFNRDQIEELFFIGFQDSEALEFQREVLDSLGELTVKNHEIIEK